MAKKALYSEEAWIQIGIVQYLRLFKYHVFSVPNGINIPTSGSRELYNRMGLLSGVSDLCVMLLEGKTLWVEVKTPVGRQSETQKAFQKRAWELGHCYQVWRSIDDARRFVEERKLNEKKLLDK